MESPPTKEYCPGRGEVLRCLTCFDKHHISANGINSHEKSIHHQVSAARRCVDQALAHPLSGNPVAEIVGVLHHVDYILPAVYAGPGLDLQKARLIDPQREGWRRAAVVLTFIDETQTALAEVAPGECLPARLAEHLVDELDKCKLIAMQCSEVFGEGFAELIEHIEAQTAPCLFSMAMTLPPNEISLPSTECPICLEPCSEDVRVTMCNHVFHRPCIARWWSRGHDTCPVCRRKL